MAVRRIVGRGVVDMGFFPTLYTDFRDGCVAACTKDLVVRV